jgi:Lrp/AsnC family transcriptional regulator, leucine-responsive regulatory protein
MSRVIDLDAIDRSICNELQGDGRLANNDLAALIGLSPSATLRRVRRLEEAGIIAGYVMLVDPVSVGRLVDVFVEISLHSQAEEALSAFEDAVSECPEVMSCHLMAGESDYLIHLTVHNTLDYERIHKQYLSRLPGVSRIRSSFAIRKIYDTTRYDLTGMANS